MATPFLSEIRIFSFGFAPKGWALCDGQLLPINQNQALFSLLGTTYGGDGRVTFGLPNLQGRASVHVGFGLTLGQRGGEESHTLVLGELPAHTHPASADGAAADSYAPGNALPANAAPVQLFSAGSSNLVGMAAAMVATVGGSQPHENRQPFLTLNHCIALQGIFPSQS